MATVKSRERRVACMPTAQHSFLHSQQPRTQTREPFSSLLTSMKTVKTVPTDMPTEQPDLDNCSLRLSSQVVSSWQLNPPRRCEGLEMMSHLFRLWRVYSIIIPPETAYFKALERGSKLFCSCPECTDPSCICTAVHPSCLGSSRRALRRCSTWLRTGASCYVSF